MPSSVRPHLALAAALVALAPTARAQRPAEPAGQLLLGAGLDGLLRDGAEFTPGPVAHLGYERRLGTSRLALRVGGDYFTQHRGDRVVRLNGEPIARVPNSSRVRIYGGGLSATYALATGRVRPYLIAGAGVQRLTVRAEGGTASIVLVPLVNGDTVAAPMANAVRRAARTSAALTGGAGVSAWLGRVGVFAEARYTHLPNGLGDGREPGGIRGHVIPLTVGVRF